MKRRLLAHRILALKLEAQSTSNAVCVFMAHSLEVSRAAIATSEDWLIGAPSAAWKFERWNTALGRKR
jgi:hypothetical protein